MWLSIVGQPDPPFIISCIRPWQGTSKLTVVCRFTPCSYMQLTPLSLFSSLGYGWDDSIIIVIFLRDVRRPGDSIDQATQCHVIQHNSLKTATFWATNLRWELPGRSSLVYQLTEGSSAGWPCSLLEQVCPYPYRTYEDRHTYTYKYNVYTVVWVPHPPHPPTVHSMHVSSTAHVVTVDVRQLPGQPPPLRIPWQNNSILSVIIDKWKL